MEPVRSSLSGGAVAPVVLAAFLVGVDLVAATDTFVFAAFTTPCALVGPPYCSATSAAGAVLTAVWFLALFALAWPFLFAGFTWGLPGESGTAHGGISGLILAAGYLARGLSTSGPGATVVVLMVVAYVVYGMVLGTVSDRLAAHRTLLETTPAAESGG